MLRAGDLPALLGAAYRAFERALQALRGAEDQAGPLLPAFVLAAAAAANGRDAVEYRGGDGGDGGGQVARHGGRLRCADLLVWLFGWSGCAAADDTRRGPTLCSCCLPCPRTQGAASRSRPELHGFLVGVVQVGAGPAAGGSPAEAHEVAVWCAYPGVACGVAEAEYCAAGLGVSVGRFVMEAV